MLNAVDFWLFEKVFQPVADYVRNMYGKTTFWIASMCALSYAWFVSATNFEQGQGIIWNIIDAIHVLVILTFAWYMDKHDRTFSNSNTETMNPFRESTVVIFLRKYTLIIFPLNILSDLAKINIETIEIIYEVLKEFTYIASLYFAACEIKPPKPRQQKESVEVGVAATQPT